MSTKGHAQQSQSRWDVAVDNPAQTERLAALLGGIVQPGAVIVLDGDLGAGKTTFVRGLADGMGLTGTVVSSPTFTLIHEYDGDVPLYHFDTYRLNDPSEFVELGAEEYLASGGVCAIEWGGRVTSELPSERLEIVLTAARDESHEAAAVGRAGAPKTYGCGGADHWHMTETDIEPSTRHIAFHGLGPEPMRSVAALKQAWENERGQR